MCFRPSVFSDVILENNSLEKIYKINCIDFIEEFTFGIDEPINIRDNIMELDNFGEKDDIIIKNDFIDYRESLKRQNLYGINFI